VKTAEQPFVVVDLPPKPCYDTIMTRSEAKAAGLVHYDQGRACPREHLPVRRLVSTGGCVACQAEHARRYYHLDPGAHIAAVSRYAKRNPEKRREIERRRDRAAQRSAYRVANLERLKVLIADWQKNNPHKRRANEAKRRALKRDSSGSYTADDIAELFALQNAKCGYCNKSIKRRFHVDHIIPLALGGPNIKPNLQLLCPSCNSRKGKKHPVDFARSLGMLV
jgi:5-methylcytosine-specific restriction endonuclease McrA